MNRFSKLLGILFLVTTTAMPSVAQQDHSPTQSRSIGLEVGSIFSNLSPEFLYLRSKGNASMRLRGKLALTFRSTDLPEEACQQVEDFSNTTISPSLAWGYQWYIPVRWARFYYGFELRSYYSFYNSHTNRVRLDCQNILQEASSNRVTRHTLAFGLAGILGMDFRLSERFSIAVESDISAGIQSGWTKRRFKQDILDAVDPIYNESSWTASSPIDIERNILPGIRVFANLHF